MMTKDEALEYGLPTSERKRKMMTEDEALEYAKEVSEHYSACLLYGDTHFHSSEKIMAFIQHWVRHIYFYCNPTTTEWLGKIVYNLTDAKILVDFFRQIGFKVSILNNKNLESYGERIYMEFERED